MKLSFLCLLFCLSGPMLAHGQGTSVLQSGSITPRHGAMWTANGVIQDSGPALGGPAGANLSELGITSTGQPFCITSAPITGPYYQLCLGANAAGGGLITYNAFGGAPVEPFNCIINGSTVSNCLQPAGSVPCSVSAQGLVPATGGGTDAFLRTDCTFTNSLTDSKTGAITTDSASLTVMTEPGTTAQNIVNWIFCASSCNTAENYDAVRGVATLNTGTTIGLVNGVGGYVDVLMPLSGSAPTSVALFGAGVADVNNGAVWGVNTTVSDGRFRTVRSDTGRKLYNEFDLTFTSPDSTGTALMLGGNSVVQPTNVTGVTLTYLDFFNFGAIAKWSQFLASLNGSTDKFALIGSTCTSGVCPSQTMQFGALGPSGGIVGIQQLATTGAMTFNVEVSAFGVLAHTGTNQNVLLDGPIDLGSGGSLRSVNDAASGFMPLEISASQIDFRPSTILSINGNTAVTCTPGTFNPATASVLNGILIHC